MTMRALLCTALATLLADGASASRLRDSRLLSLRGGQQKEKVAIIGSGNWGSAIAKIVGRNVLEKQGFDEEVRMWVFEEVVDGKNLTSIINSEHENVKYLKGVKFTENVVADPELESAVKDATLLIFVLPHQFLTKICPKIKGNHAKGARACSLIKGIEFDESGPALISGMIKEEMGGMDVSVLMGANVANEAARDEFCESTVGFANSGNGAVWQQLFDCPTFRVNSIGDVAGVELCGALKNVVALGAGFCDGLGLGGNTKAAIIRIGLGEMIAFCKAFYGSSVKDQTFLESCGVADLITTCFGGRNRKCAEAFAKGGGKVGWDKIEAELLNGQKLQGTITAKDVVAVLSKKGMLDKFPLFAKIHQIAFEGAPPEEIVSF